MSHPAFRFLSKTLTDSIHDEVVQGAEVARHIENESEMLIPLLERIESRDTLADECKALKKQIRRAEYLTRTHTKRRIQIERMMQSKIHIYRVPIYLFNIRWITSDQFRIKDEIATSSDELLDSLKEQPDLALDLAADRSVPSYLKRCINYFQLFPPNFEVPVRRLVVLWVAEGLVHSTKHDKESAEKIAESYLNELIHLEVVVVKRNRSGQLRTCRINIDKRNQLLANQTANLLLQGSNGEIHRLVHCNDSSGDSFIRNLDITQPLRRYRNVVSFLSFNTEEISKPGKDIGGFLSRCISDGCFKWLGLLDLERVFRPHLPKSIGKLIGLKYLGLRWTCLEKLPDSVEELFNLQVLDVKHTYISLLPKSIWTMAYLRHLYLNEAYRTRFPDPPSSKITLAALQTLWGAFIDEDTRVEHGLDTLKNIRKLGLLCMTNESPVKMYKQLDAIDKWISTLKMLESLRLKSRDENGNAADLRLTSLEGNKNLTTLYLLGKIKASTLPELPLSLTDITLSGSELAVDPMEFLGRLPNLVILQLLANSVECRYMYCARNSFRRLKVLCIWRLEKLEELKTEEGSLPSLEELEIRSCNQLKKLPDRLSKLENLEIKLMGMQKTFVDETRDAYDVDGKDELHSLKRKQFAGSNSSR